MMTTTQMDEMFKSINKEVYDEIVYERKRFEFIYPFERYISTKDIFRSIVGLLDATGTIKGTAGWISNGGYEFYGYDFEVFEIAQEYFFEMQC